MLKVRWWQKKMRTAPPQEHRRQAADHQSGDRDAEAERDRDSCQGPDEEGSVDTRAPHGRA